MKYVKKGSGLGILWSNNGTNCKEKKFKKLWKTRLYQNTAQYLMQQKYFFYFSGWIMLSFYHHPNTIYLLQKINVKKWTIKN